MAVAVERGCSSSSSMNDVRRAIFEIFDAGNDGREDLGDFVYVSSLLHLSESGRPDEELKLTRLFSLGEVSERRNVLASDIRLQWRIESNDWWWLNSTQDAPSDSYRREVLFFSSCRNLEIL